MRVLVERRRDGDVLAWLLVLPCAFAAWRARDTAPLMAAAVAVLTVTILGAWIRWRVVAPRELTVTHDEITFGRPGQQLVRIPRAAGPLELRTTSVRGSSLWLGAARDSGLPGVPMLGFQVPEVRQACTDLGWELRRLG